MFQVRIGYAPRPRNRERAVGDDHSLWDCLLDYLQTYTALRNFSAATRRGYGSGRRLFVEYLSDIGSGKVEEVQRTHLHNDFVRPDCLGQAGATRARKRAAVKSFFTHLQEQGLTIRAAWQH